LRFVASPVEFIPPDRVVPGLLVPGLVETILSRGVGYMWGDYSPRPADLGYVVEATHRHSWAGRDSLRETAWFPGLAVCPSAGHSKSTFPVHCNHSVHSMQGGFSAPLALGKTVAPALLADVWCTMIVTRLLATGTE